MNLAHASTAPPQSEHRAGIFVALAPWVLFSLLVNHASVSLASVGPRRDHERRPGRREMEHQRRRRGIEQPGVLDREDRAAPPGRALALAHQLHGVVGPRRVGNQARDRR